MRYHNRFRRSLSSLRGSAKAEAFIRDNAGGLFVPESIIGSNPVTAWNNVGRGGGRYNLNVPVGTGANLITLESGVALFTGTNSDNFSTSNTVDNSVLGDIDIRFRVALVDYTPIVIQELVTKGDFTGDNFPYRVNLTATGLLFFQHSPDGTAGNVEAATASAATGRTDGVMYWFRVTMDVDNGAAGHDNEFFYSTDDVDDSDDVTTWVKIGDTVTTAGTTSIHNSTAPLYVGAMISGGSPLRSMTGKAKRAQLYDGIGGTLVADFDPRQATVNSSTFTSGGTVWTANGDAFVNATAFPGLYSRGSVGLETTAGQLLTGTGITVYAVFKPTLGAPGADQFIFDARSTAGSSLSLRSDESNSDKYTLNQGSDIALSQAYDNDLQVYTAQFLGTSSTKLTASAGSVTGDAGSENWDFGSIFMALGAGSTMLGLLFELGIFEDAHSAGQIAFLRNHYGAKYA